MVGGGVVSGHDSGAVSGQGGGGVRGGHLQTTLSG